MNTPLDQHVTSWFTSGFGNPNLVWLGHIVLFVIIMLVTVLLTGVIGLEREQRGHAAGFRTHILVGLASALIMYISIWGFATHNADGSIVSRDPARLAAQVVSGIGFLGAGAIIQTGVSVKGLTTATTLWLVMAIGLAVGSGNIIIGTIATGICLIALVSFRKIEKIMTKRNPIITLMVALDSPVLKELLTTASRFGVTVKDLDTQVARSNDKDVLRVRMQCSGSSPTSISAFVEEMKIRLNPLEIHVSNGTY